MRFCVLASGSSGNASLLVDRGFGVLLDLGLGPRTLADRLEQVGASWDDVHAALLTHVHGDHCNDNTLAFLQKRNIPLFCHKSHARALRYQRLGLPEDWDGRHLRFYEIDQELTLTDGLRCLPLRLKHDGGVTCGFRLEGGPDSLGQGWALGYAADLGSWDQGLVERLANVDVLALEFNHDELMEKRSCRTRALIQRVLSDHGHLSNDQAAELLVEVLAHSHPGRLQYVVQLHLSRQCNRRELALVAARRVLQGGAATIGVHPASQDAPLPWLTIRPGAAPARIRVSAARVPALAVEQPWLPGWDP